MAKLPKEITDLCNKLMPGAKEIHLIRGLQDMSEFICVEESIHFLINGVMEGELQFPRGGKLLEHSLPYDLTTGEELNPLTINNPPLSPATPKTVKSADPEARARIDFTIPVTLTVHQETGWYDVATPAKKMQIGKKTP